MAITILKGRVTRREWLRKASGIVVVPYFVPANVFGNEAPSEQLAIGCIGVGRQGREDMQNCLNQGLSVGARVVAVCDLDANRAMLAKHLVDKFYAEKRGQPLGCKVYNDYRELLDRGDIDGVMISTPDHWHALNGVAAAQAGKDIYIQKPLTYSIGEGQKLVEVVRAGKCVLQTGTQHRSSKFFNHACQLVLNKRIGRVHTVRVVLPEDKGKRRFIKMPVPEALDYDTWLGPARVASYTEDRVHPQVGFSRPGWLQIEDYSHGMITGWGAHMNDLAQWGVNTQDTGPVEVVAQSKFPSRGLFNVHTTFHAEATYANGIKLFMGTGTPGVKYEGDEGWIHVTLRSIEAEPKTILDPSIVVDKQESDAHMRNFLECMKSRKDPVAPVEVAHRSNTVCIITHIAMKLGRKLRWNPDEEQFVDDDEANALLDYPHREPWIV